MKPTKAYILKIDTPLSNEYAASAAKSCEDVGLPYEFFTGFSNMRIHEAWRQVGFRVPGLESYERRYPHVDNPQCCSAGHAAIWKKIADGNEAAIVLEHDAIMLHKPEIDIPDDRIVVLGYKSKDPSRYDHIAAGAPSRILDLDGHEGAHAYALTPTAAKYLVEEISTRGILGCVDNAYFIRGQRATYLSLAIMDPTPALGWIRKSTLWDESADRNYEFIDSFRQNYK